MKTKPIVIIGGGFAGLRAALTLDKLYGDQLDTPIYLIDAASEHSYMLSLFHVLADADPNIVSIPFKDILEGTHIRFINEKVVRIDTELKSVHTEKRQLKYQDLILAVGTESRPVTGSSKDEFLAAHTLDEVLKLKQHLSERIGEHRAGNAASRHYVSVIGAGVTGVEFALGVNQFIENELASHHKAKKGTYVTLIEASDRILPTLNPVVSRELTHHIKEKGISLQLKKLRTWREVIAQSQVKSAVHTVVWTVGVQPRELARTTKGLRHSKDGRVLVDPTLQAKDLPDVWVVGGAAALVDAGTVPGILNQGEYVARALRAKREGQTIAPYQPKKDMFVLELSTRSAVIMTGERLMAGFWVKSYQKWLGLRYLASIVSWGGVFKAKTKSEQVKA